MERLKKRGKLNICEKLRLRNVIKTEDKEPREGDVTEKFKELKIKGVNNI